MMLISLFPVNERFAKKRNLDAMPSDVWKFFDHEGSAEPDTKCKKQLNSCQRPSDKKTVLSCKICKKIFTQTRGNTTNIRAHLVKYHSQEYLGQKLKNKGSSNSSVSIFTKKKLSNYQHDGDTSSTFSAGSCEASGEWWLHDIQFCSKLNVTVDLCHVFFLWCWIYSHLLSVLFFYG